MAGSGRESADGVLAANLAAGATIGQAATLAGVSERTVHRRLRDPAFRRRVNRLRRQLVSRAVGLLSQRAARAVEVMADLLECKDRKIQLNAARNLLAMLFKGREAIDLEELAAQLEGADDGDDEGAVEEVGERGEGDDDESAGEPV